MAPAAICTDGGGGVDEVAVAGGTHVGDAEGDTSIEHVKSKHKESGTRQP